MGENLAIVSKNYLSLLDPDLEAELEERAKLENPDAVSPTLEKQMSCLVASTSYKYAELEDLTIRKLVLLLRTVDTKLHYFTYRQAEASGMVSFKHELTHWIYGNDKRNKFDGLQSLDSFKEKMSHVAKM